MPSNSNLLKHMKKKMEGQKVFQLTNWTHIDIPSSTFHKKSMYISALSWWSLHFLFVFLCNFTGQRHFIQRQFIFTGCTGKSLLEVLILASTNNPQYDKLKDCSLIYQFCTWKQTTIALNVKTKTTSCSELVVYINYEPNKNWAIVN